MYNSILLLEYITGCSILPLNFTTAEDRSSNIIRKASVSYSTNQSYHIPKFVAQTRFSEKFLYRDKMQGIIFIPTK